MPKTIDLGEFKVDVIQKDIKNVHLSVVPPDGKVRISAPKHLDLDVIRAFAISRIGWIKKHQQRMRAQSRETKREYIDRESHYVWGKRCLLSVIERESPPMVELNHGKLILQVRPGTDAEKRQAILEKWYRLQVSAAIPALIEKWEPVMDVSVAKFYVQRMKTRWGSCNIRAGNIRLNSELAKKSPECLEYVVVHEMVHLLERLHNDRFKAFLDHFMPLWKKYKEELNRSSLNLYA